MLVVATMATMDMGITIIAIATMRLRTKMALETCLSTTQLKGLETCQLAQLQFPLASKASLAFFRQSETSTSIGDKTKHCTSRQTEIHLHEH